MQLPREKRANALRIWFATFLREFRSQLEKLPEDQQKRVLKGNDFRIPCQIMIFWMLEPQYQYVMIIRDPRIPYDVIKVYGPALLATMTSQAETMLKDPWFDASQATIDPSVEKEYKNILETHLLGVIRTLSEAATSIPVPEKNKVTVVKRVSEESKFFEWSIYGNILRQNPTEFAAKTVADRLTRTDDSVIQENTGTAVATHIPSILQPTRQGFLSAFYPPIWLGEPLSFGFREKVDGIYIPPNSRSLRCAYKGRELTILRNGVLTMIEPERSTCLTLLNEIMCTALLIGIPSSAVRDQDLAEAMFYDNGELGSYSLSLSDERRQSTEKEYSAISEEEFKIFSQLSEVDLKKMIETAERSTVDPMQSDYAKWFIDAYSYWKQKDYDHSVMRSWLTLEKHAIALWEELSRENSKQGRKATRERRPPMEGLLKDLLRGKAISGADYRKLNDLRDTRNKIMHKDHHAKREVAEEFLAFAEDLTRKKLALSKK
jgi:hypothetical protein